MAARSDLHALLVALLGSSNVYFQPPPSLKLSYPCIIYKRSDENTKYAGNKAYSRKILYLITVIDRDPDSLIPEKVAMLPLCSYARFYEADNLNHDVYNLYF